MTSSSVPLIFTGLPPELRLKIYKECLVCPEWVTLRLIADLATTYNWPEWYIRQTFSIKDTSILRTSRQIYKEALNVFYGQNRFYYKTQSTLTPWPAAFSEHLYWMRHVSLELHQWQPYTAHSLLWSIIAEKDAENLITHIASHTPQLRTFSLYVLSTSPLSTSPRGCACPRLRLSDRVRSALENLKARIERLSIITFGPDDHLSDFTAAIAPKSDWLHQTLTICPLGTIHWQPNESALLAWVFLFEDVRGDVRGDIRAWHTSRQGVTNLKI